MAAPRLVSAREVAILQGGRVVDPSTGKGPGPCCNSREVLRAREVYGSGRT